MEEDAATHAGKPLHRQQRPAQKRPKVGKPRGQACHWTSELDELLRTAWSRGGLRAARRAIRQQQPTWSRSSIKKRAAALALTRPKARPWSTEDVNKLLMSIDSNASLELIAKRLNRTVAAIRYRLWELGYKAASLGGYKVKEVAEMLWRSAKKGSVLGSEEGVADKRRSHHRQLAVHVLPQLSGEDPI